MNLMSISTWNQNSKELLLHIGEEELDLKMVDGILGKTLLIALHNWLNCILIGDLKTKKRK